MILYPTEIWLYSLQNVTFHFTEILLIIVQKYDLLYSYLKIHWMYCVSLFWSISSIIGGANWIMMEIIGAISWNGFFTAFWRLLDIFIFL